MKISYRDNINSSKFMQDYLDSSVCDEELFDFSVNSEGFINRLNYLKGKSFNRNELCDKLLKYNRLFNNSNKVIANIEKLKDENSVVIIGGQQAGLLTGPLYTIHKIITIIKLAEEKSVELNTPVVPVFWIAGEDHDFDEVNHVFNFNTSYRKISLKQNNQVKSIISKTEVNHEDLSKWIENVFSEFGESEHTNVILDDLYACLHESNTIADFFANIISKMFAEYGLVLFDSGSSVFSDFKLPYFKQMIINNEKINKSFLAQKKLLQNKGYKPILEIKEDVIHLFFEVSGERQYVLKEGSSYTIKDYANNLEIDELLELLESNTELFTNNVVTRPIMQEMLFPVLSFVGGPGEIAYWAELKGVFEALEIKMPVVFPRYSITYIEKNIEAYAESFNLSISEDNYKYINDKMNNWFYDKAGISLDVEINGVIEKFSETHRDLRSIGNQIGKGFDPLLDKNLDKIIEQVLFVKSKYQGYLEIKHEADLNKWKKLSTSLYPLNGLQERVWNVFYFINKYGPNFIDELLKLEKFEERKHNLVRV
jgi:bacillithiol biosynthesis cysteine-adding enzyme BshC